MSKKVPTRRRPYGRRPDSHVLIDDPSLIAVPAEWFPLAYQLPMPRTRGRDRGCRWLVACPKCARKVKTIYSVPRSGLYQCRHCWGLKYPSQYRGRRPEASPYPHTERLDALLESAFRARSPEVRMRRLARLDEAMATRDRHELRFLRGFAVSNDAFYASMMRQLRQHDAPA